MDYVASLFSLSGKTALVTGATSGIGKHVAHVLVKAGADVILNGRNTEKLKQAQAEIENASPRTSVSFFECELTELDSIELTFNNYLAGIDGPDILVNAAGTNLREKWQEISPATWRQTIDLNLSAPFFVAKGCVPFMLKKGYGRIINVASLQSVRAFPNSMPYGASKGGVTQLTRAMAEAWSKNGITSNAVAPGFFPTPLTSPVFSNPELALSNAKQTAVGRNGKLDDLDGTILFLASPASAYITGQTIFIDGGFTAK